MRKRLFIHPACHLDPTGFAKIIQRAFSDHGWDICNEMATADHILMLEHPRRRSPTHKKLCSASGRKILVRFEPKVVNPLTYRPRVVKLYDLVLNIGTVNNIHERQRVIRWPYLLHNNPSTPTPRSSEDVHALISQLNLDRAKKRPIDISIVAANKIPFSRGSNYSLRREIVLSAQNFGVSAYGQGWNMGRFLRLARNLRIYMFFVSQLCLVNPFYIFHNVFFSSRHNISSPQKKIEISGKSNFQLVIENSNTYVTEKILDCMLAGAIPIYRGPSLAPFGIPETCYIKFPPNASELGSLVQSIDESVMDNLRQNIKVFLKSSNGFALWQPESVAKVLVEVLT